MLYRLSAVILAFGFAAIAQNYPIQTFAGGAPFQNVPGPTARLGVCTYVVVDATGNVFMRKTGSNHRHPC
jgi:hypothetical protein